MDRGAAIFEEFNDGQRALVERLRDMSAEVAEHAPGGDAWTAAQVAWHVALTNTWMAGVLLGDKQIKPSCQPPADATRDAALAKLRASGQQVAKAIASLSSERAPSLADFAESAARHVAHHLAQIDRIVIPV
jgi:uncharacterized damage-inducible protein DinB